MIFDFHYQIFFSLVSGTEFWMCLHGLTTSGYSIHNRNFFYFTMRTILKEILWRYGSWSAHNTLTALGLENLTWVCKKLKSKGIRYHYNVFIIDLKLNFQWHDYIHYLMRFEPNWKKKILQNSGKQIRIALGL